MLADDTEEPDRVAKKDDVSNAKVPEAAVVNVTDVLSRLTGADAVYPVLVTIQDAVVETVTGGAVLVVWPAHLSRKRQNAP